jgi:hypothetical protein
MTAAERRALIAEARKKLGRVDTGTTLDLAEQIMRALASADAEIERLGARRDFWRHLTMQRMCPARGDMRTDQCVSLKRCGCSARILAEDEDARAALAPTGEGDAP